MATGKKLPKRQHDWWKFPNTTIYYRPPGAPETYLDASAMGRMCGQVKTLFDFETGKEIRLSKDQLDNDLHARASETLVGNPYGLVLRQHVVSRQHLSWFAGADGRVFVLHKKHPQIKPLFPKNKVFCAPRLWSDSVELWGHAIEEAFYKEVRRAEVAVRSGEHYRIANQKAITEYWTLCRSRVRVLECPPRPTNLGGQTRDKFTQAEKDALEYEGFAIHSTEGDDTRADAAALIRFLMHRDMEAVTKMRVRWRVGTVPSDSVVLPDLFPLFAVPIAHDLIIVGTQDADEEAPPACRVTNFAQLAATFFTESRQFLVARSRSTLDLVRAGPADGDDDEHPQSPDCEAKQMADSPDQVTSGEPEVQ